MFHFTFTTGTENQKKEGVLFMLQNPSPLAQLGLLPFLELVLAAERKLAQQGSRFVSQNWFLIAGVLPGVVPLASTEDGRWHIGAPDDSGMAEPRQSIRIDRLLEPSLGVCGSPWVIVLEVEGKVQARLCADTHTRLATA